MARLAATMTTLPVLVAACGSAAPPASPNPAPTDAAVAADVALPGAGSPDADVGASTPDAGAAGAYGAACDSEYTDGCQSSDPGPGTAACGEDITHCCETRRGCAAGLTCVGATCTTECSAPGDCTAVSTTAACVFVFSTSNLKGCFEPCSDAGVCAGGLVCRQALGTDPTTCQQYIMP
jgi:hypothetical protein